MVIVVVADDHRIYPGELGPGEAVEPSGLSSQSPIGFSRPSIISSSITSGSATWEQNI
jgi:hypothetical protein